MWLPLLRMQLKPSLSNIRVTSSGFAGRSLGNYLNLVYRDFDGNGFAKSTSGFDMQLDGVFDVFQSFFVGFSLGVAPL